MTRTNLCDAELYVLAANCKEILGDATAAIQYQDSAITAYINSNSPLGCYNRLTEYIKGRQDIDPRSQIPSAKSDSFQFEYIGTNVKFIEAHPSAE